MEQVCLQPIQILDMITKQKFSVLNVLLFDLINRTRITFTLVAKKAKFLFANFNFSLLI